MRKGKKKKKRKLENFFFPPSSTFSVLLPSRSSNFNCSFLLLLLPLSSSFWECQCESCLWPSCPDGSWSQSRPQCSFPPLCLSQLVVSVHSQWQDMWGTLRSLKKAKESWGILAGGSEEATRTKRNRTLLLSIQLLLMWMLLAPWDWGHLWRRIWLQWRLRNLGEILLHFSFIFLFQSWLLVLF